MVMHVIETNPSDERGTLLAFVEAQRGGLRRAVLGLTDAQAAKRTTDSELTLGGLLKHVAEAEQIWVRMAQGREPDVKRDQSTWGESFRLIGDETVAGALEFWERVAAETETFVRSVGSLEDTFPLPDAPWFPPGARVSMRWMLLHLVEEIGRHAGHADILRESLDGRTAFELVDEAAKA
ncbi:DinB family protein [Streptomyces sp. ISL-11]|uniref:DinB family protein n=1 Tax=Streptomyces sp. ISL-11 TaxID=2819174 RepID=UPI001BE5C500|nr:DinB family protein [Streptomyces sp. ISL-11]MBT2382742.1 DinB family protein [Streptomyces sp. ISL-11]